MHEDLTILYYTADYTDSHFADSVRMHLLETANGIPIISVSHEPLWFGEYNICVGRIERSAYNIYKQILLGAKEATTPYIACCEDDCLYNEEHFKYRPPIDTFAYNINRWNIDHGTYFYRQRAGMCMNISPRQLLIDTLIERFKKYPDPVDRINFGEPGRVERKIGLPPKKMLTFKTGAPTLHFNHRRSCGGRRRILTTDIVSNEIKPWGEASKLWERIHG